MHAAAAAAAFHMLLHCVQMCVQGSSYFNTAENVDLGGWETQKCLRQLATFGNPTFFVVLSLSAIRREELAASSSALSAQVLDDLRVVLEEQKQCESPESSLSTNCRMDGDEMKLLSRLCGEQQLVLVRRVTPVDQLSEITSAKEFEFPIICGSNREVPA